MCFTGDGGFYYHLAELESARRCGIPVTVIVNNNSGFGQNLTGVRRVAGNRPGRGEELIRFGPTDFTAVAGSFGVRGIRVEGPARDRAGARRGARRGRAGRGRRRHRSRAARPRTVGTRTERVRKYSARRTAWHCAWSLEGRVRADRQRRRGGVRRRYPEAIRSDHNGGRASIWGGGTGCGIAAPHYRGAPSRLPNTGSRREVIKK